MTGQLSGSNDLEVQIQMRPWDCDESQESAEDEVIRTEPVRQLHQLMPRVAKSIAKMDVTHPEVLRTTRAHQAFQHVAAALRDGSDRDFYYKSRKSHKISTFWSHSWHGGHWKKILTLILRFARQVVVYFPYNGSNGASIHYLEITRVLFDFWNQARQRIHFYNGTAAVSLGLLTGGYVVYQNCGTNAPTNLPVLFLFCINYDRGMLIRHNS